MVAMVLWLRSNLIKLLGNRMNQLANDDIWLVIFSYLDNDELGVISQTGLWTVLRQIAMSSVFWYRRCRVLTSQQIDFLPSSYWNEAYRLLGGGEVTESATSLLLLSSVELNWNGLLKRSIIDGNTEATQLLLQDSRIDPLTLPIGILTFQDLKTSQQALAATYAMRDRRARQSSKMLSVLATVLEEYRKADSTIDVELFANRPPTPEHMNSLISKHIES